MPEGELTSSVRRDYYRSDFKLHGVIYPCLAARAPDEITIRV